MINTRDDCTSSKAFKEMMKFKRENGSSEDFCKSVIVGSKYKRKYYSAEYLGEGWLRHVSKRNTKGRDVYYERPPGEYGKSSVSLIPYQNRLRTLGDLQKEWPQFYFTPQTFQYGSGEILNRAKFYRGKIPKGYCYQSPANLHKQNSSTKTDAVKGGTKKIKVLKKKSCLTPDKKVSNKKFLQGLQLKSLTTDQKREVFNTLVKSLTLTFFKQKAEHLNICNFVFRSNEGNDYKELVTYLKRHEFKFSRWDRNTNASEILFILIARVINLDACLGLPGNRNLIKYLQKRPLNEFKDFSVPFANEEIGSKVFDEELTIMMEYMEKYAD